jgi:putative transposase
MAPRDEVLLKINGKRHWLWRLVDRHGVVLDICQAIDAHVQPRLRRNAAGVCPR